MNENKPDKLFRDNAEYLADQPHGDFDPTAFWQQLQPELSKQNQPNNTKKRSLFWWQSVAAAVLLILLAVGTYRAFRTENPAPLVAVKPEKIFVQKATEKNKATSNQYFTAHKPQKAASNETKKSKMQIEILPAVKVPIPDVLPPAELAVKTPDVESIKQEFQPEEPILTQPKSEPAELRIVHRNELRNQEKQQQKARTQVAIRLGFPAAQQPSAPSGGEQIPLKISIQKVIN
ncbi:hypothetical protein [Arundinibacter roseus]|uniref:Uncharacterized protein n=1 Tax=Arundinibacter roseus TaxID=2070510 RepID=A0A4R4KB96_9BACT|nr:hypothetical protein [Arundinibacter roseus]TDB63731.1 hypothetical protein EZE20_15655 [Arundinibacter roseus]